MVTDLHCSVFPVKNVNKCNCDSVTGFWGYIKNRSIQIFLKKSYPIGHLSQLHLFTFLSVKIDNVTVTSATEKRICCVAQ